MSKKLSLRAWKKIEKAIKSKDFMQKFETNVSVNLTNNKIVTSLIEKAKSDSKKALDNEMKCVNMVSSIRDAIGVENHNSKINELISLRKSLLCQQHVFINANRMMDYDKQDVPEDLDSFIADRINIRNKQIDTGTRVTDNVIISFVNDEEKKNYKEELLKIKRKIQNIDDQLLELNMTIKCEILSDEEFMFLEENGII